MCALFLIAIATVLASGIANPNCQPCPVAKDSGCHCWYGGISCEGSNAANASLFPQFQPTTAICNTSIYIHDYTFKVIPSNAFDLGSKVTVYQLTITSVQTLASIQPSAFSGMTALLQLGIYYCRLSSFPTDALQNVKNSLTSLSITNCYISNVLDSQTFRGLSQLASLNLDGNVIRGISYAFVSLPNLSFLSLKSNLINTISSSTFAGLTSLATLFLDKNPITNVAAYAFSGTGLPKLTRLSLEFSRATTVEPMAFDMLPSLTQMSISITNGYFGQHTCTKSMSISCAAMPKLQQVTLHNAVCADILQPLATCINRLYITQNEQSSSFAPVCLNQLASLQNLHTLSLTLHWDQTISFNLDSSQNFQSLIMTRMPSTVCDEVLGAMSNLVNLTFSSDFYNRRYYIPKAVQKMQHLKMLSTSDHQPVTIVCNCSSYWLYNFTNTHDIDTSTWKCKDIYGYSVKQFLLDMHKAGKCTGPQPDFQEWAWRTCSNLCPSSGKSTKSTAMKTTSTTVIEQQTTTTSPTQSPGTPSNLYQNTSVPVARSTGGITSTNNARMTTSSNNGRSNSANHLQLLLGNAYLYLLAVLLLSVIMY